MHVINRRNRADPIAFKSLHRRQRSFVRRTAVRKRTIRVCSETRQTDLFPSRTGIGKLRNLPGRRVRMRCSTRTGEVFA